MDIILDNEISIWTESEMVGQRLQQLQILLKCRWWLIRAPTFPAQAWDALIQLGKFVDVFFRSESLGKQF